MKSKFILLLLLLSGYVSQAQMRYFYANLNNLQEVPTNTSIATGVAVLLYNTANKSLQVVGDFQRLKAAATAGHIHGPAAPGINAAVLFPLAVTADTTGTITSTAPITLTPAQEADLYAGNYYVNVHNSIFTGGEIRGQVIATDATQTEFYNGRLQGAQQVPPNASTGTGSFALLLDKTANMVYLTGNFSGLTVNASDAHIHTSATSTNGPVIIPVTFTPGISGTIHKVSAITVSDKALMQSGGTYVNIHNATYPGGEIRGQVNMFSQYSFFKTVLSGSNEVPVTPSTAKGTVIVKYNSQTKFLELIGDFQGLVAAATAGHIHSPATVGVNAPVLFPMAVSSATSGTISGTATLTLAQEADLFAGNMYVNVHNATYPGGEVRGQLSATSAGETQYFTAIMQGAQENPSTGSAGTGNATVILDKKTREVFVTATFSGLAANASAGHLHRGQTGVNGPVVFPLSVTPATAGTMTGSGIVSQGFADSMVAGLTYINVHNATFGGGELRAQLGNQVLPLKLAYFNGYKDKNNVVLLWETAQEIDVKQFEVEQQDAATRQWIIKGTVKANGLQTAFKYRLVDVPLKTADKYVIYRLKMLDKNGSFTYSNAVRINYTQSQAELIILANPVTKSGLRYTITGLSTDKKAEVSVIDFNGRVIYKTVQSALSTNTINVSNLSQGMYKLVVKVDDVILQQSFIK